jgi:hypothetical protein
MAGGTVAKRQPTGLLATLEQIDVEDYPALIEGIDGMLEAFGANVGGKLDLSDLVRVGVPTGGDTEWKIPSALGAATRVPVIEAIPIHWADSRVYWPGVELSSEPPSCWSTDGKTPDPMGLYGDLGDLSHENLPVVVLGANPKRLCAGCPMDQWGSSPKEGAKGKACKQQKLLFVLEAQSMLPMLIQVPPTSLAAVRKAMIELTVKTRAHYSGFKLAFSLVERVKNGNKYGEIVVKLAGALPGVRATKAGGPEEGSPAHAAKAYSDAFGALLTPEVLAAAAAGDAPAPSGDTGLGGDFADHGEGAGT